MAQRHKLYAVVDRHGNRLGVFDRWYGIGGADEVIEDNPGARAKGCRTIDEANAWFAVKSGADAAQETYDELLDRAINGEPHLLKQAEAVLTGKSISRRAGGNGRHSGLKIRRSRTR